MPCKLESKKGMALFLSIALFFLLSIGVSIVLIATHNYAVVTENEINKLRAYTLAEAGVNYVIWKLRINENPSGEPIDPATMPYDYSPPITKPTGWDVTVTVDPPDTGTYRIRSKVTYTIR